MANYGRIASSWRFGVFIERSWGRKPRLWLVILEALLHSLRCMCHWWLLVTTQLVRYASLGIPSPIRRHTITPTSVYTHNHDCCRPAWIASSSLSRFAPGSFPQPLTYYSRASNNPPASYQTSRIAPASPSGRTGSSSRSRHTARTLSVL
jgi:hypothetical protein